MTSYKETSSTTSETFPSRDPALRTLPCSSSSTLGSANNRNRASLSFESTDCITPTFSGHNLKFPWKYSISLNSMAVSSELPTAACLFPCFSVTISPGHSSASGKVYGVSVADCSRVICRSCHCTWTSWRQDMTLNSFTSNPKADSFGILWNWPWRSPPWYLTAAPAPSLNITLAARMVPWPGKTGDPSCELAGSLSLSYSARDLLRRSSEGMLKVPKFSYGRTLGDGPWTIAGVSLAKGFGQSHCTSSLSARMSRMCPWGLQFSWYTPTSQRPSRIFLWLVMTN